MRIAFWGINSATGYSGGRYCAWMMAEALASKGHEVHFITNNIPAFVNDFAMFPDHKTIVVDKTPNFASQLPTGDFDLVVIVPHMTLDKDFFVKGRQFAFRSGARLVLINFESGNWFNEVAPVKRDLALWDNWVECCEDGCLVLSLTRTGKRYAQEFYQRQTSDVFFAYSYPAINTIVADTISVSKEKQITVLTRFIDPHKGAQDISELLCESMAGYTVVVIVGNGETSLSVKNAIHRVACQYGIPMIFKYRLSDAQKFEEIAKSVLMLFPSRFEGYGYPPVEALYCNTPVIAFDLPVLREVSGKAITYVPVGDFSAFREAITRCLETPPKSQSLRRGILSAASFTRFADDMDRILTAYRNKQTQPALLGRVDGSVLAAKYEEILHMLCDLILAEGITKLSLFGAGKNGQMLYGLLNVCGVEIVDVFDDCPGGQLGRHKVKPLTERTGDEPIALAITTSSPGFLPTFNRLRLSNGRGILVFG